MFSILSLPIALLIVTLLFFLVRRNFSMASAVIASVVVAFASVTGMSWYNWQGVDVLVMHIAILLVAIYILSIITHKGKQQTEQKKWHWGPVAIVSFFVVVILVDIVFVTVSTKGLDNEWVRRVLPEPSTPGTVVSQFPGTVSHDFREKEDQFNVYQQQRLEQKQRGWQIRIGWKNEAQANTNNTLLLEVKDKSGLLVKGAQIKGKLQRPGNISIDQTFKMNEIEPGLYMSEIFISEPGRWDAIIGISLNQDIHEVRMHTFIGSQDDKKR